MPDASDIRLSFTIDGEEGIFFRLACNYDEGVEGAEYHLVNCDTVIDELSKAQSPSDVSRAVRLLAELDFENAVDDDEAQRQIDEFDTFLERIAHIPSIARFREFEGEAWCDYCDWSNGERVTFDFRRKRGEYEVLYDGNDGDEGRDEDYD